MTLQVLSSSFSSYHYGWACYDPTPGFLEGGILGLRGFLLLFCGYCLHILRCLTASLASTDQMPVASPGPAVTPKCLLTLLGVPRTTISPPVENCYLCLPILWHSLHAVYLKPGAVFHVWPEIPLREEKSRNIARLYTSGRPLAVIRQNEKGISGDRNGSRSLDQAVDPSLHLSSCPLAPPSSILSMSLHSFCQYPLI